MSAFTFHLDKTDGKARTGRIDTPRGTIRTPAFPTHANRYDVTEAINPR